MKKLFIFIYLLNFLSFSFCEDNALSLSVEDAVSMAVRHSRQLQAEEIQLLASKFSAATSWTSLFPNIGLIFGTQKNNLSPKDRTSIDYYLEPDPLSAAETGFEIVKPKSTSAETYAQDMLHQMAAYAGVSTEKEVEEPYVIDIQEPDKKIEIGETPVIFKEETGEPHILKDKVYGIYNAEATSSLSNIYKAGDNYYYIVDKDGKPYTPTKGCVQVVEVFDKNKNNVTQTCSYESFRYYRKNYNSYYYNDSTDIDSWFSWTDFWNEFLNGEHRDDYDFRKETDQAYDYFDTLQSATYICYKRFQAKVVTMLSEADDSIGFLTENGDCPTKRIVIFTHGTLFYKWIGGKYKQHGDTYLYRENGEPNTAEFLKDLANDTDCHLNLDLSNGDQIYHFNWNGDNDYDVRDGAGKALVNFIYNKVSANLYDCNATQIFLIGHSHGVTVNTIAMRNINAEKLAKFGAEIPLVIGFNGIGTSTCNDLPEKNEKSNRDCYIFPDVVFNSLENNNHKTKMYNFYADYDGVVPPGFDDFIVFPYNEEWEYDVLMNFYRSVVGYPLGIIFAEVQSFRFFIVSGVSKYHQDYRKMAWNISNAENIDMCNFIDIDEATTFYKKYMTYDINYMGYALEKVKECYSISMIISSFVWTLGVNGDSDLANAHKCRHQLPRQYSVMEKCLNKIYQKSPNLFDDKQVYLTGE